MEQSALFFDIDGTILSEVTCSIPESALQALKRAREKGHLVFINTGRTWCTYEQSRVQEFWDEISEDMDAIDREGGRYEIVPKGYSKATACDFILKRFGIPKERCYVFGDSSNDLAMFEYAPHAIAMGEHSPVLEPYTEFVTRTVEEDGIAYALSHYGFV